MYYSLYCHDKTNSLAGRKLARPNHLARLRLLQDQGRLLLAGPFPAEETQNPGDAGFTGSLVVAEFDSMADARAWADADPYVKAGVYASVDIKPFIKVSP
jgi:uncharacterized protein YciI